LHWVGSQNGGLDAERELILTEQTPAEIVFLSAADTDLTAVASQWGPLFGNRLRLSHAAPLRQPVAADFFVQNVVAGSRLFIARLLGGRSYFPHLLQALSDLGESSPRPRLLLFSATEENDADLSGLNDFELEITSVFFRLFSEGGAANLRSAGAFAQHLLHPNPAHPNLLPVVESMPSWGWYKSTPSSPNARHVWLTFYRALYQTGDLDVVDALVDALEKQGLLVSAFFCQSLKQPDVQEALLRHANAGPPPDLVLTLQSFAVGDAGGGKDLFPGALGCPLLQVPVSAASLSIWLKNSAGLSPSEATIQVALPEIDGRILASVAGFKEDSIRLPDSECTLKKLCHEPAQVLFIAQLAANWVRLRTLDNAHKRVAIILANYPNRDGRIGNGVGLDTPASAIEILRALAAKGYHVPNIPQTGDALMQCLLAGITNDAQGSFAKNAAQSLQNTDLQAVLEHWPALRREEIQRHWPDSLPERIPIAGIQFGNVFIGIQPPRGFSLQTQSVYHSPDLPPPPQYVAFYSWLREHFSANAIIHLGKHGNLEWLPGRALALGGDDYPQLCLGPTPPLSLYRQQSWRRHAGKTPHLRGHPRPPHSPSNSRWTLRPT
jgi:cobaltochelatase CobN